MWDTHGTARRGRGAKKRRRLGGMRGWLAVWLLCGVVACGARGAETETETEAETGTEAETEAETETETETEAGRGTGTGTGTGVSERWGERPHVRVLGSVQDGGLPHVACTCTRCDAARAPEAVPRYVASLAIVLPATHAVHVIDATPDFRAQLDALADVRDAPAGRVDRAPLDGVLLTHAHLGHYTGLPFLGFEAVHAEGVRVWATPPMNALLRANVPFSELVRREEIVLHDAPPGARIDLGEGVTVTPVQVPHRDENADTVAFRITGPSASVFYAPDTDGWDAWDPPVEHWLRQVDVALLDGTFFSGDELPGRDVASIGHPMIAASLERFAPLADEVELVFTHLNHSNPALTAGSAARARVEAAGMTIAREGATYAL